MQPFSHGMERDPLDTDFIRMTFRSLVQKGIIILVVINLLNALVLWFNHSALWPLNILGLVVEGAFYPLTSRKRSFKVFLPSVLLLFTIVGLHINYLAHKFGAAAGFHFLIIALIPLVIFTERIGLKFKALISVLLCMLMLRLELVAVGDPSTVLSAAGSEQLRLLNLTICFAVLALFATTHFVIVSRIQSELHRLAAYDPLTQLLNRRRMGQLAEQAILQSRRQQYPLSVILADIDHFKKINDLYGHPAGDAALRHVSSLMQKIARDSDSCCRWGGEEFLILLPHTDLDGAAFVAERIREEISTTSLQLSDREFTLNLTFGVAALHPFEDLASAVMRADTALYEGKRNGRNCVVKHEVNERPE